MSSPIVTINGTEYPLIFSMGATRDISKEYGSVENMSKMLFSIGDKSEDEQVDFVITLLAILAKYGAIKHNMENRDQLRIYTKNEVMAVLEPSDLIPLVKGINEAIRTNSETTVVLKDIKKKMEAPAEPN